MTGNRISAAEGQRLGPGRARGPGRQANWRPRSSGLVDALLGFSPLALRTAKEVLDRGTDGPLYTGIELERKAYAMLRSSRDFAEGVEAFTEKRAPQFEGR